MRKVTTAIIHCADTPNGKPFTVNDIDDWHRARDFRRAVSFRQAFNPDLTSIGYHWVIYTDGSVHSGRSFDEVGAHCQGANTDSVGICMMGRDKFAQCQWDALKELLNNLNNTIPYILIKGHYEFPSAVAQGKTCPNFDVPSYVADGFVPDEKHIL